jgi:hypothetical protein
LYNSLKKSYGDQKQLTHVDAWILKSNLAENINVTTKHIIKRKLENITNNVRRARVTGIPIKYVDKNGRSQISFTLSRDIWWKWGMHGFLLHTLEENVHLRSRKRKGLQIFYNTPLSCHLWQYNPHGTLTFFM